MTVMSGYSMRQGTAACSDCLAAAPPARARAAPATVSLCSGFEGTRRPELLAKASRRSVVACRRNDGFPYSDHGRHRAKLREHSQVRRRTPSRAAISARPSLPAALGRVLAAEESIH